MMLILNTCKFYSNTETECANVEVQITPVNNVQQPLNLLSPLSDSSALVFKYVRDRYSCKMRL